MVTAVAAAREVAGATPDPELPMVTLADLGILRSVSEDGGRVTVTITPTYSGCPAMREISADLAHRLAAAGYTDVEVRTQLSPAWTTDWITDDGRRKLTDAGIAPPRPAPAAGPVPLVLTARAVPVPCPRCGSSDTERTAAFSATACKSLHRCRCVPGAVRVRQGAVVALRSVFHPLRVSAVERLCDDAAAVTFDVPPELAADFDFAPGQSLTVRRGEERRSYSICAPRGRTPRIGVREVAGGAVSGWLVHEVRPGDLVDVQPPTGSFTPDLERPGHHVLVAAGSGITPVLSIAGSLLEAGSRVTLLYGNRRSDSVMFADDVADLKDAHPARMTLVHVLSREAQEVELFNGRLDAGKLRTLLPLTVEVDAVDGWWLCGPFAMVTAAIDVLHEFGVPDERVHRELFYVEDVPPAERRHDEPASGPGAEVTVVLDGRRTALTVPPGTPVLDGAQRVRPDLPFACKGGVCGTCRALVVDGRGTNAAQLRAGGEGGRRRLRPDLPGGAGVRRGDGRL